MIVPSSTKPSLVFLCVSFNTSICNSCNESIYDVVCMAKLGKENKKPFCNELLQLFHNKTCYPHKHHPTRLISYTFTETRGRSIVGLTRGLSLMGKGSIPAGVSLS